MSCQGAGRRGRERRKKKGNPMLCCFLFFGGALSLKPMSLSFLIFCSRTCGHFGDQRQVLELLQLLHGGLEGRGGRERERKRRNRGGDFVDGGRQEDGVERQRRRRRKRKAAGAHALSCDACSERRSSCSRRRDAAAVPRQQCNTVQDKISKQVMFFLGFRSENA